MADGSTGTILVVDDEATFGRLIRDHLERAGHKTIGVDSAEAALEQLRIRTPDLMLLDVHMPGMTGLELLELLRREDRVPPTIVMSAYGQLDTALEAVRAGAAAVSQGARSHGSTAEEWSAGAILRP